MPTFIGSLLVIPIMLITRLFKLDKVGFIAALLASITWSYYNRTMTGYYDTDMLVVVLPSFFIWGILLALTRKENYYLVIAPTFALLAMSWHGGEANIINSSFFLILIYTLIYERHNKHYYQFLSTLVIALTTLSVVVKFMLIIILVGIFHFFKDKLTDKIVITITILSALIYLYFGGMLWIIGILNNPYLTRALHADDLTMNLHYYGVINTIRETGHIPFETFANRISGHTLTFVLSIVGYLLLIIRYRLFILTLPMVILGFFALQGGLRFTVFAIPFMAMGVSYLIFLFSNIIKNNNIKNIFILLSSIAILYPNIKHVLVYKVPTVFNKYEVQTLDKLKSLSSRDDYVISWWDYGFPIRYYADVKTLIDGAQHSGSANYPVSSSLLNNPVAAANMARLSVESNEINLKTHCGTSVECILKYSHIKNPNLLLDILSSKDFKPFTKTNDIFFYLPNRMLSIIPTIDLFSNLNLLIGQQKSRPLFFQSTSFRENANSINLGGGIELMKKDGMIKLGKDTVQLNQLIIVEYDTKGRVRKNIQRVNPNSNIFVIFMKNYKKFLVLDKRLFNSLYIQLFVLENYDKDLYELVISDPYAKVYKLKI